MKLEWMLVTCLLVGCSDKGDDSQGGGDDGGGDDGGGDDGGDDSNTPPAEDADNDGFAVGDDCDDGDAEVNPDATEVCDDVDNDCDGDIDVDATDATAYYGDADADTYGAGKATMSCTPVTGSATQDGDCDDADAAVHPGATEVCDDLDTDEDCDSLVDDDDDSLDTSTATLAVYIDGDGDGFGVDGKKATVCNVGPGYAANAGDCNDASSAISPSAAEVCGDKLDEDCDGEAESCLYSGKLDPADAHAHILGYTSLYLGFDATAAGDMNGDGLNDLAVGTAFYGVFVLSGPVSGTIEAPKATAFIANSKDPSTGIGQIEGIGDQDSDGYDDLLTSGYLGGPGVRSGNAWVLGGPLTGSVIVSDVAMAAIYGDDGSWLGLTAAAGDVNDDGMIDPVLGAPAAELNTGATYVFFGPVSSGELTPTDADVSITGVSEGDFLGGQNAANGDIDGDGVNELLVSAYMADYVGTDDGAAYLFYGPVSGTHAADEADTVVYGGPSSWELGWFTSIGGDLDADGQDDLVISANGELELVDGAVYLFYAPSVVGASELDVAKADVSILGDPGALQQFGRYVDTAGDLDTDGYDDLAVGSPFALDFAGSAWGFYGPLSGTIAPSDASFYIEGTTSPDQMGTVTAFVGDVTGDGADDLAIGESATTVSGGSFAGQVLLLDGRAK